MKKFAGFILVFVSLFLWQTEVAAEEQRIAIGNVTVITMNGDEILENATVIIYGDRIIGITSGALPRSLDGFIDSTGKYLIPGLAEMHGHIPSATSYDQNLRDTLFLYLAAGVTTVRGMLGAPGQLELQQDILDGDILGPTLYLGGPSFNGRSVSSPDQARQMVRDQAAEGWDFLKIHPGLSLAEYNAMADEATRLGITWGGHVPEDVGLARALEAGQVTIDHLDGYDVFSDGVTTPPDEEKLAEAVQMTLEAGAYVVPTNHLWAILSGLPEKQELEAMVELQYVTPETRRANRNRYSGQSSGSDLEDAQQNTLNRQIILKALSDAGAWIVLGSDAPQLYSVPGFSIQREMEAMAAAGMSPEAILYSGTAAVGEFFADKDKFGVIAPGYRADLILLDANPLEDISNIRDIAGVMVRGIWLSREDIDAKLKEIAARNAD